MMSDLSKIFDLSKRFALPDFLLKSKKYCTTSQCYHQYQMSRISSDCFFSNHSLMLEQEMRATKLKKSLPFASVALHMALFMQSKLKTS